MRNQKVLQVNSNLEVELWDFEFSKEKLRGQSLIQEVSDNFVSIIPPENERYSFYLYKGDKVHVSIFTSARRYIFVSEVLAWENEKGIPLIILKKPQEIEAFERRDLVRVETWISVNYAIILPEEKSNWKCIEPLKQGYTIDLSGGGLQLILSRSVLKGDLIVFNIPLEIEGNCTIIKVLGKVKRTERRQIKGGTHYRIGVVFEDITKKQQDLIIKYIFNLMRKNIQTSKDDL